MAIALDVLGLLLPLHFRAPGEFGNGFPPNVGGRLTIGFLIRDFTPTVMVFAALFLLWRRRNLIASGTFLATGILMVLRGVTAPLYALPRLQPLVLMTLRLAIGVVLFVAAWLSARRPSLPPPPP